MKTIKKWHTCLFILAVFVAGCSASGVSVSVSPLIKQGFAPDNTAMSEVKVHTFAGGGLTPAYRCDESVYFNTDTENNIEGDIVVSQEGKRCAPEDSTKKTILGSIVPRTIRAIRFIASIATGRPDFFSIWGMVDDATEFLKKQGPLVETGSTTLYPDKIVPTVKADTTDTIIVEVTGKSADENLAQPEKTIPENNEQPRVAQTHAPVVVALAETHANEQKNFLQAPAEPKKSETVTIRLAQRETGGQINLPSGWTGGSIAALVEKTRKTAVPVKTTKDETELAGLVPATDCTTGAQTHPRCKVYVVKKGDTLIGIARRFARVKNSAAKEEKLTGALTHTDLIARQENQYLVKRGLSKKLLARSSKHEDWIFPGDKIVLPFTVESEISAAIADQQAQEMMRQRLPKAGPAINNSTTVLLAIFAVFVLLFLGIKKITTKHVGEGDSSPPAPQ